VDTSIRASPNVRPDFTGLHGRSAAVSRSVASEEPPGLHGRISGSGDRAQKAAKYRVVTCDGGGPISRCGVELVRGLEEGVQRLWVGAKRCIRIGGLAGPNLQPAAFDLDDPWPVVELETAHHWVAPRPPAICRSYAH